MLNSEQHFAETPLTKIPRSTIRQYQNIRTTFNAGELIPFYVNPDILPAETWKLKATFVIRQSTPIHPTMDNAFADVAFFYVPNRIVWTHFKDFLGENTQGAWASSIAYSIPQCVFEKRGSGNYSIQTGDIADYMGLPLFSATNLNAEKISVSDLPFRAYIFIWNEYYRNAAIQAPAYMKTDDTNSLVVTDSGRATNNWLITNIATQTTHQPKPAPVNREADAFSTAHIQPQFGAPVTLPLGTTADVILTDYGSTYDLITTGFSTATEGQPAYISTAGGSNTIGYNNGTATNTGMKLSVDLTTAVAATINAQRLAFQTQKILERKTYGSRMREIIWNFFGTRMPDSRAQIPEFLCAKRVPINMTSVAQTSSTDSTTPQGNLAAYSLTVEGDDMFTKSFTEHGMIFGMISIKTQRSYSQGIDRGWSKKLPLDFYWPQLATLGEVGILNKEIYADGTSNDDEIFGYQERWYEYRYTQNKNTGLFRPTAAANLASWHYGDHYNSLPLLVSDWSLETKDNIDRTIAVTSAVTHQFIMDCQLTIDRTIPMPLYSLPGYIDHF